MGNFQDISETRLSFISAFSICMTVPLKDLCLADSGSTDEIDLLIGSEFYQSVVTGKTKTSKNNKPVAVETKLGWVLNGTVTSFQASTKLIFESDYSHVLFLNTDHSSEKWSDLGHISLCFSLLFSIYTI